MDSSEIKSPEDVDSSEPESPWTVLSSEPDSPYLAPSKGSSDSQDGKEGTSPDSGGKLSMLANKRSTEGQKFT